MFYVHFVVEGFFHESLLPLLALLQPRFENDEEEEIKIEK